MEKAVLTRIIALVEELLQILRAVQQAQQSSAPADPVPRQYDPYDR